MRVLWLVLLLALAARSSVEHAAGTTNPAVTTPAEAPVSAGSVPETSPAAPDSAVAVP